MFCQKIARRFICIAFLLLIASACLGVDELFRPAQSYYAGGSDSRGITVADVNGDGNLDLLTSNQCIRNDDCADGGRAGVLLGNGDGTFQPAQSYRTGGQFAGSIAVGDINGDGKADLMVANYCTACFNSNEGKEGLIGVLLGNGDGTFQPAQTYDSGGYFADAIAVGDVNRDGKLDVLVNNECPDADCQFGAAAVLLGHGDGTFQPVQTYSSGGYGYGANSIVVKDLNGDGNPDLAVASDAITGVLFGNGDGTFQPVQTAAPGGFLGIAAGDVNGDGIPDLALCRSPEKVGLLLGNGDGTFQPMHSYRTGAYGLLSIAMGDANGDGKPDLLVSAERLRYLPAGTPGLLVVLLGNGDGTFQPARRYRSGGPGTYNTNSVAAADLNRDGKLDLISASLCGLGLDCARTGAVGVLLGAFSTTTILSSSPNPSSGGQPVTFTATVTSANPFALTGTVIFSNGAKLLGKGTLTAGVATLTTRKLPAGTFSITARYNGNSNSAKSTSEVLIQVVH